MANMGYKILAKFCREKEVTDAHKEGILMGMHIMALQTEKWFDNEDHAMAYRMDTWDECGFSGWREIYEHTKGFLEAKQPEESEEEMKERLQKNYEKVYSEKCEESDVSDMEVTDDEEGLTWAQLKEEMKTKKNESNKLAIRLHAELQRKMANGFEVVDKEDDEGPDWTQYTFENVDYLVGPGEKGKIVLETEDYQPVGIFEDKKIVFEDNLQVEYHFQRVRDSTIPEDREEAFDLITSFLEDHYDHVDFNAYDKPYSLHVFKNSEDLSHEVLNQWFYFGVEPAYSSSAPKRTNVLGKNMGEVMKDIESLF